MQAATKSPGKICVGLLFLVALLLIGMVQLGRHHVQSRLDQTKPVIYRPVDADSSFVLFGDSRAAGWPADLFPSSFRIAQSAVGGEVSHSMLSRLETDVLQHAPDAIVLVAGINDIVSASVMDANQREKAIQALMLNLETMISVAIQSDVEVIFLTIGEPIEPDIFRSIVWGSGISEDIARVNEAILRKFDGRIRVIDTDLVLSLHNPQSRKKMRRDSLHYTREAYANLTRAILEARGKIN